MRCPDCSKFVSMDNGEPEDNGFQVDDDGLIEGSVRATRVCADCSTELKEYTFDFTMQIPEDKMPRKPTEKETEEGAEMEVEVNLESTESGGGRYAKNMVGVSVEVTVTCTWDADWSYIATNEDSVGAGSFDECC